MKPEDKIDDVQSAIQLRDRVAREIAVVTMHNHDDKEKELAELIIVFRWLNAIMKEHDRRKA